MGEYAALARGLAVLGATVATVLSLVNSIWGLSNRDLSRLVPAASWFALGLGLLVIAWSLPADER